MNRKGMLRILFVFLFPALYVFAIGRYGWSDTDDGFILGYAWRVLSGEIPYRDFVAVRPPLSFYLHSVWFNLFPLDWVYIGARYVYVFQILLSAILAVSLIESKVDPRARRAVPWTCLTLAGFFLSVGALTPMPWHTVDGIFFAVITLFFLSKKTWVGLALGGVALFMACLAKQSYYPLVPFCVLMLVIQREYSKAALLNALLALLGGLYFFALKILGAWPDFVRQTVGASTLRDAVDAGILNYFHFPWRPLAYSLGVAILCRLWVIKRRRRYAGANDFVILVLAFGAEAIYQYKKTDEWAGVYPLGLSHFMLWLALGGTFLLFKRGWISRDGGLTFLGLIGIAWCASVSWGFQTPLLFAAPLVTGGYLMFACATDAGNTRSATLPGGVYAGLAALMALGLSPAWHPYRDAKRPELVCDLGTVNSKLNHIMSTPENCKKLGEALSFDQVLKNEKVVFLPAFTLRNYLAGVKNPLRSNWPMNAEMGPENENYQKGMDNSVRYVVIDRQEGDEFSKGESGGKFHVSSVADVRTRWTLLQQGQFYDIYGNPDWPLPAVRPVP